MRKIASLSVLVAASCLAIAVAAQPDSPAAFVGDTARLTRESSDYRRVLHTGEHLQLALTKLEPGESTGTSVHADGELCLFAIEGVGRAWLDRQPWDLTANSVVCVPAGTEHDVENTGPVPMRLYTVLAPPVYEPDAAWATRDEAEEADTE